MTRANLAAMFLVAQVVFIDIWKRGLCLWNLYRMIDSSLAEKEVGKGCEDAGGTLKPAVFSKVLECIKGKHIFPCDIVAYCKDKKLHQNLVVAYFVATSSMLI
jgi:hypothetical protein